jgi:hypothetical protein
VVLRTLRTEELSRDVQGLASHNNDLLAIEQLLSNSACQPTEEMTLAIDCDLLHTVESASIAQISLIVEPESFSIVLTLSRDARRIGRLTVGSKVDIFVLLHGGEKTDVGRVAGILYLRDGGGVVSICRGLLECAHIELRKLFSVHFASIDLASMSRA